MHLIRSFGEFFSPFCQHQQHLVLPVTIGLVNRWYWPRLRVVLRSVVIVSRRVISNSNWCQPWWTIWRSSSRLPWNLAPSLFTLVRRTVGMIKRISIDWRTSLFKLIPIRVYLTEKEEEDKETNTHCDREREHLRPSISLVFQMIEQLFLVLLLLAVLGLLVLGVRRDRWRRMECTSFISRPFVSFVHSEWHPGARTRKYSSIRRPKLESHFQHWTILLRSICPWSSQRTKKSIDVRLSLSFVPHLFVSSTRCLSSAWDDQRYNGISRTTTGLSYFSKRFWWDFLSLQADDSSFTYELIIVDDGSPDKTSEVRSTIASNHWRSVLCLQLALTYSARYGTDIVRVLTFDANRGKGGAVRMVR